jgi:hypothetical protein
MVKDEGEFRAMCWMEYHGSMVDMFGQISVLSMHNIALIGEIGNEYR